MTLAIVYYVIFGATLLIGASAVYGMYWAARTGQFRNMEKGALDIFDLSEPVGRTTDSFPGETWGSKKKGVTPAQGDPS
jgi:nitrogen fixation-related uncharacterized protein